MKRILSLVLCAVMLISTFCATVSAAQYNPEVLDEDNLELKQTFLVDKTFVLGDATEDGSVNAMDSHALKTFIAGASASKPNLSAIDLDADGSVNAQDSYIMKICLAGKKSISEYDSKKQLYSFNIGGVSIDNFTIVIPADAEYDSNLYFATELLYEYIKKATGVALTIERGTASKSNAIYLYNVPDDSELGAELGHEGYKYQVIDGNLHIYGTHRGNMYAAYEIIEEYLGYSFALRDYTFSYKQRYVNIEEGTDETFVPVYKFRHTKSTYPGGTNRESGYVARRLNGTQAYGYKGEKRSVEYYGDFVGPVFNNIHSYSYYWAMGTGTMPEDDGTLTLEERYYAKYQSGELKSETEWEPCATSNDSYNKLFTGLVDTIRMIEARGYPIKYEDGTNCYSFSLNDNNHWCTCRNCSKEIRTKTGTGLYLELASRGARDIQEYYPGLKLFTWTYTRETPTGVTPDENLVIVLSGFNCANHPLGGEGENECINDCFFGHTNNEFEERMEYWHELSKQTGVELWFWYYPESHYFWFVDIPNVYTIYNDMRWLNEHGVTGMFYEGSGGRGYLFENLKAYLATEVIFNPYLTPEEYDEILRSYLYECYGRGWENIYTLLAMYEEAGNAVGFEKGDGTGTPYCFIGNYDRAFDLVSITYINENYETMRNLILAAIEANDPSLTTNSGIIEKKLNDLFNAFEILGLAATYLDNYVNGTEEQRAEYERRYAAFLEYYHRTGMTVSSYSDYNVLVPTEVELSYNPGYYFFPGGSRRTYVTNLMGPEREN